MRGGWLARLRGSHRHLGRVRTRTLLVLLVMAFGGWTFAELADDVMEGETRAVDEALLLALRVPGDTADPLGAPWVEEMARDVTALGSITVVTAVTLAVAGFLWLQGHRSSMAFLLVSVAGGILASHLVKLGFDRPRPDLVSHGVHVMTASFPSGHSMHSAVTYLTLAVLSARVQERRAVQVYLIVLAALVAIAVGVSRVYLGVHWPTDVVAGWCAGAVWALACWLVARWLSQRGAVEPEVAPGPGRGGPG